MLRGEINATQSFLFSATSWIRYFESVSEASPERINEISVVFGSVNFFQPLILSASDITEPSLPPEKLSVTMPFAAPTPEKEPLKELLEEFDKKLNTQK